MAALARVGPYGADRQPDGPARAAPEVDVVAILDVLAHVRRERRRRAAAGRCCCWPLLLASSPHEQQQQALNGWGSRAHAQVYGSHPTPCASQLLAGGSTHGRGEAQIDVEGPEGSMVVEGFQFCFATSDRIVTAFRPMVGP